MGIGFTVTLTLAAAAGHTVEGTFVVKVTTAKPEAIVGVKMVVNALVGLKVPEGELHVAEVAEPPIVPVNVIVAPAHTLAGGVMLTVAGGNTYTVTEAVSLQPLAVTIKVYVCEMTVVPLFVKVAVGFETLVALNPVAGLHK